jgi:hypothetical protein
MSVARPQVFPTLNEPECQRFSKLPTRTFLNMDEISLAEVSSKFSHKLLEDIIGELETAYPDEHPRTRLDDYQQGFKAGAIEVIRRLKEMI